MNQNAELSQTRPPGRRDAVCEPLWRYEDLAPALPPHPVNEERERRSYRLSRRSHARPAVAAARKSRRSA